MPVDVNTARKRPEQVMIKALCSDLTDSRASKSSHSSLFERLSKYKPPVDFWEN